MSTDLGGALAPPGAEELLREGRQHESAGRVVEAIECYAGAVDLGGPEIGAPTLAEALRRLGVLHHLRAEPNVARDLCRRSYQVAVEAGAAELAAEALNA